MTARLSSLEKLARALDDGQTTSRALTEQALANIKANLEDGGPVFLLVDDKQALARADQMDDLRKQGRAPSKFAGIPFSLKDLFDVAGQVTTAGSLLRKNAEPAGRDAVAIERLRSAGFVALGRTNMTEFAYSGVGLNPHYGTPKSVYDRKAGRIPGGSSSGAAVSVGDGTCALAIGSDTGGSCRVPAAFNGIVGYKSSVGRVPTRGVFPLAKTFDVVGPLAQSVQCCASADALMARDWDGVIAHRDIKGMKLGVPQTLVLDDLDDEVATVFGGVLTRLACQGAEIVDVPFDELAELPGINAGGGIGAVEAYGVHAQTLASHGDAYDQRVRKRILAGANISTEELNAIKMFRREIIAKANMLLSDIDAFVLPTTAKTPALISDLNDDADYGRINLMALRNTFVGNFLDCCAISVPAHETGSAPVGIMLMAAKMSDKDLFSIAAGIERQISPLISR